MEQTLEDASESYRLIASDPSIFKYALANLHKNIFSGLRKKDFLKFKF